MKIIRPDQVPHFESFQKFSQWYCRGGPYILYPEDKFKTILIAPDSTQTIMFRWGTYQVELYVINFWIPRHHHPLCETFEWMTVPGQKTQPVLLPDFRISEAGVPHGGTKDPLNPGDGYLLLVLQNWNQGVLPFDHISLSNYVGPPLSVQHMELMKSRYPQWIDPENNWIDTTKCKQS